MIIDMMLWHLRMMDDDFIEKQIFGSCVEDDEYAVGCRNNADRRKILNVMKQNKECFMELFSMFYWDLWD